MSRPETRGEALRRTARLGRWAREGGWIVGGQIAAAAGSIALVRVLTGFLKPAEYGHLALALAVGGLAGQLVTTVNPGIGRFYSVALARRDLHSYAAAVRVLLAKTASVTVLTAMSVAAIASVIGKGDLIAMIAATTAFCLITGVNSALASIQTAARQRATVALHQGADAWARIGLAVASVHLFGATATAAICGFAVSALALTASQAYFCSRLLADIPRDNVKWRRNYWISRIWSFSWPFTTWGIFTWMQQASDRWALECFSTADEVGQFAVLFQLGYAPMSIATGSIVTLILPVMYQQNRDDTASDARDRASAIANRATWLALTGTAIATSAGWAFHESIFRVLAAAAFGDHSHLLPITILAGGVFAAGQIQALRLMSGFRTGSLLRVKVLTAVIGIACNAAGAWMFGITGVSCSLLAFSVTYLAAVTWACSADRRTHTV